MARSKNRRQSVHDDEVGYCRPPKAHQFKKGQSGNRGGRPKGVSNVRTSLEKVLTEPVKVIMGKGRARRLPGHEAILRKLMSQALMGEATAQRLLLTYMQAFGMADRTAEPDAGFFLDGSRDKLRAKLAALAARRRGSGGSEK